MSELQILTSSATFLNTWGYVGVALLLGLCAWWFYKRPYMIGFWITGTFGLTFLLIFGALDIISRHFPDVIVTRPPLLIGRIANVGQDTRVSLIAGGTVANYPYMRRENDPNDLNIAHHRFIFPRRSFPCLMVAVTTPDGREPKYLSVALPTIDHPSPNDELYIKANGRDGQAKWSAVWVRHEDAIGTPTTARDLRSDEADCAPATSQSTKTSDVGVSIFGTAYAQNVTTAKRSPEEAAKLLQSDDAFVRRHARIELGTYGVNAEPKIQELLLSGNYRFQIGAVESINSMKPDARKQLSDKTWSDVRVLSNNPDPTLRDSAQKALANR